MFLWVTAMSSWLSVPLSFVLTKEASFFNIGASEVNRRLYVLNPEVIKLVLAIVDEIPAGRVATYGQIARLIGRPKNARLVGKILSQSELYGGKHPCHRVVNAAGRLTPGWEDQAHLLWAEGVDLKVNGCVDLKRYQWER